jgi:glycosyltransferase involved in cell wall biosynthesis
MSGKFVIGIDASRNRSGGARAHLIGILSEGDPFAHNISEIHVWAYKTLLDSIPDSPWLIKHNPKELEQSLIKQLWWQATKLSKEAVLSGCDILFTTDASTLCRFKPNVVLSQDLLSYEPGLMTSYGITKAHLRLYLIMLIQNCAFRFASGVIFLTEYAAKFIQQSCGSLSSIAIIHHGVSANFKNAAPLQNWPDKGERSINCLYVSNAELYKHQWVVVHAIAALRRKGYNLSLKLVGGGMGRAQKLINEAIKEVDPNYAFVIQLDFVSQNELIKILVNSDLFVFASSCENMPVTLVESMAVGLPIACSNRGPMPEILSDGGVYFDPENLESIAGAIEKIVADPDLRLRISSRAKKLSDQYSWSRCADETLDYIVKTYQSFKS